MLKSLYLPIIIGKLTIGNVTRDLRVYPRHDSNWDAIAWHDKKTFVTRGKAIDWLKSLYKGGNVQWRE